jgi:hypothetical protein
LLSRGSGEQSISPPHPTARYLIANRFIYINLLNLGDGSPYCEPPLDLIKWELPLGVSHLGYPEAFAITGSRVMMYVSYQDLDLPDDTSVWRMSVWDWKTGDLVRVLQLQEPHFIHFTF